jgi:predicted  nucleic acid-binding Zn-ribbon protein
MVMEELRKKVRDIEQRIKELHARKEALKQQPKSSIRDIGIEAIEAEILKISGDIPKDWDVIYADTK